ncbi:MAG TPA: DoxX family protein [Saprospiraceae bacterium]|nr:DoxX family protein [Saprospiraceae bacterium]HPI05741.1 DoxX family protein [Saprospiraceae bacterium]
MSKTNVTISWILRIIAAVILGQTLFFKFTGAEESKYIFSVLGMEPAGRYGSGVAELIAVVLLLMPRTAALGGLLGLGVISGALMAHLTKLGIEVQGDGGLLFYLAVAVFVCCAGIVWLHKDQLVALLARFRKSSTMAGN